MLDKAIAIRDHLKEKPLDPNYRPEDAIQGRRLINQKSDRLAVIFPWWHNKSIFYRYLVRRLARKGWAVLAYDFHDQILEPDEETVLRSMHFIQKQITWELSLLTAKHQYKEVHFIGLSLGNVPLTLVADSFQDFTGATIVAGGDDLAKDMWHGLRTLYLRDEFKKEKINETRLDKDWWDIAPQNHVRRFAQKNVYFYMPLHDRFILTKYQKRLAKAIEDVGAKVFIKKSQFGHALSIARFCLLEPPY
ncbi:MAG TPA: hypothetical protein VFB03_00685 [Candidatus Saccharimonadales bacterium]|nr:hypothetical protein [Candidatus Saccharimonadales bacterium]